MTGRPAVFFDRDGTLNVEKNYVHVPAEWAWLPGAVDALRRVGELGLTAVVVTNQSGVGRGYYDRSAVTALHDWVAAGLSTQGISVAGFYFCPHVEADRCDCRKPAPGLLTRAARELGLDLARSFMIGDKAADVAAARAAGVTPILVLTGYGASERAAVPVGVAVADDVVGAVRWIEGRVQHRERGFS